MAERETMRFIEARDSRERESDREEHGETTGYRQRRHNNQEYDNTQDGCLPSPQTSVRILRSEGKVDEEGGWSEMKDDE